MVTKCFGPRKRKASEERRDRGQLILIAAILLSVVVISSVLLLNTAQSVTELQTDQQSQSLTAAERTSEEVSDDLERLFLTNQSAAETGMELPYSFGLADGTTEYDALYRDLTAANDSALVAVEYDESSSVTGGIVFQPESGSFESADGDSDWSLLEDITTTPRLAVEIDDLGNEFTIRLDGSGESERFEVEEDGTSNVYTLSRIVDGTEVRSCDGLELPIAFEFESGYGEIRSRGTNCERVAFGTTLDGPYHVTFDDDGDAKGTYIVTGGGDAGVDDTTAVNVFDPDADSFPVADEPNYRGPDDDSSTGDAVVVNPEFTVTYDDPDITYRASYGLYNQTGR